MFSSSRFNLDDFCIVYKSNNLKINVYKKPNNQSLAYAHTTAMSNYRGNHFEYTLWQGPTAAIRISRSQMATD